MNYSIIRRILGVVIQFTGAFLALPALCGLFYGEKQAIVYAILAIVYFVIGKIIASIKLESQAYYAREGLVIVGLSWIVISILGAIPLVITKDIPSFTDALFETVSGFTTTGSSILTDVEAREPGPYGRQARPAHERHCQNIVHHLLRHHGDRDHCPDHCGHAPL